MAKLSVNDVIKHVLEDEMEECDSDEDFDGYVDDEETERILQHRTGYGEEMNDNDDGAMNEGSNDAMNVDYNGRLNRVDDRLGSDTLGDDMIWGNGMNRSDAKNGGVEECRYGDNTNTMDSLNGIRLDVDGTSGDDDMNGLGADDGRDDSMNLMDCMNSSGDGLNDCVQDNGMSMTDGRLDDSGLDDSMTLMEGRNGTGDGLNDSVQENGTSTTDGRLDDSGERMMWNNEDDGMYVDDNNGFDNDVQEHSNRHGNNDDENSNGDDNGRDDDTGNDGARSTTTPSPGSCTKDMRNKTPIDFFKMLVTIPILENIVQQTNLYSDQFFQSNEVLKPRSRLHLWKKRKFCMVDLFKFLALLIIMGIVKLPRMEDHWKQKWPYGAHSFAKIMSRDYFSLILEFFHLNDSTKYVKKGEPGHDPLYKIRPLLTSLIRNFNSSYKPNKQLSIDEAMVSFKGRAWFLQYMPKKPTKWGLKAFSLADSRNGYTLNWRLYTGKDQSLEESNNSATHRTVMALLQGYEGNDYQVYMDNYYTGVPLFQDMVHKGFQACGTARVDRVGILLDAGTDLSPEAATAEVRVNRLTGRHFPIELPRRSNGLKYQRQCVV